MSSAQRASCNPIQSINSSDWGSAGSGWVWKGRRAPTTSFGGWIRGRLSSCCRTTASAFWGHRSSAWKTTGRTTWTRLSIMRSVTIRYSTSLCSTRPFRERRCTKNTGGTGRFFRRRNFPLPMRTGSIASITATRISVTDGRNSICWMPSGGILRSTVRVCSG